jgi:hypothetical protein
MEETNLIEVLQEIKETLGAISDSLYSLCEILEQTKAS